MKITKYLSADIVNMGVPPIVDVMQGDDGTRVVSVSFFAAGVPWTPPEGVTASVAFKKPDGTSGWYDKLHDGAAACTIAGNDVVAELVPEVAQVSGKVNAAIVFQNADLQQIASFPIVINVVASPSAGNKISNSYYKVTSLDQLNAELDAMRALFGTGGALILDIHQEDDAFVWDTPFNWEEIATAVQAQRQVVVRLTDEHGAYTYYLLTTAELEDSRLVFSRPVDAFKVSTLWVTSSGYVAQQTYRLGTVSTINGEHPDEFGNLEIETGGSVDLSNYCTKDEIRQLVSDLGLDDIPSKAFVWDEGIRAAEHVVNRDMGDISSALDHIIALQEELISL